MIRLERRLERLAGSRSRCRGLDPGRPPLRGIVLAATGHNPLHAYRRLFDSAFVAKGALSETLVSATPLAFTGLAAAVAFRMQLFNIGAEASSTSERSPQPRPACGCTRCRSRS